MLEYDKYFITFFSGDQFTSVPRGQFASAEGVSLDWRKGGILKRIFHKELEKKIEENNKNYKQQLEKLSKEVKDVEMKYGSTPELKEIKTFIHKEQTIAETNEQYQRPQNVVNAEDDYQQQEINLDQDKKDEKQKIDLPFEEDLKIDEKQQIKYNDLLDNWEREQIWKQERMFNEKEADQEQSRGRSR